MARSAAARAPLRRLALAVKGCRHGAAALGRVEAATPSRRHSLMAQSAV